jgi:hypothetical protein
MRRASRCIVKKGVSLGAELAVLQQAVLAAADSCDVTGIPEAAQVRQLVAILHLIAARLRQLRRAVVGAEIPENLLAPHNVVTEEPLPGDDPDILLEEDGGACLVGRRRHGGT